MITFRRLKEHWNLSKLKSNDRILVFRSPQFHKSAIYDIETNLIDLAKAEGNIELRNTSINQNNYMYFLKNIYEPVLFKIWEELKARKLTFKSIEDIRELNKFKFSPYKALNSGQREAVSTIKEGNTVYKK